MSNATDSLNSLLERAENVFAGEGMTNEDPLHVEVNGKYVDVLFSTGGPHVEIQFEFDDAEAGEYWFEHEARGGRLLYLDWGTREETYVTSGQAWLIQSALMRDEDDLVPRIDKVTMTVITRQEGIAQVEVDLGEAGTFLNDVDDMEPYEPDNELDTVWGPILQRALDEAVYDLNAQRHGLHDLPDLTVTGWEDVLVADDDDFAAVFEVSVKEFDPNE